MPNLILFDLDDTLLKGQSQKLFLSLMRKNGYISAARYSQLMAWFVFYKLGLARNTDKVRTMAYAILAGKSQKKVESLLEKNKMLFTRRLINDAVHTLKKHQNRGEHVALISASNNLVVKLVANYLNVDSYLCTELEQEDDRLTGKILGKGLYGEEKLLRLNQWLPDWTNKYDKVVFYTDHHSDLPLLLKVDQPRCVNPDKRLLEVASQQGWITLDWC